MAEIKDLRNMLARLQSVINRMAGIDDLRWSDPEIECAKDMLWRARRIEDKQFMLLTVSDIISASTRTKWALIKNFDLNCNNYSDSVRPKETARRAADAIRALSLLTECVRIEYDAYALLGEERACHECLSKYASFLFHNKLYQRDSIFWMFSNLPVKDSEPLLNEDLIRAVCDYCNCFS